LKSFLFQILKDLGRRIYINEKQLSMIKQKITKRQLEIVNLREHFDVIHVIHVNEFE